VPASLGALLSHLFASRFAHPFVDRFLRRRFPMTLPRRVDWSAAPVASQQSASLWLVVGLFGTAPLQLP
jgi:hypothetical protein